MRPQQGLLSSSDGAQCGPQLCNSGAPRVVQAPPGQGGAPPSQQRVTLCARERAVIPRPREQHRWVLRTCVEAAGQSGAGAASHPCKHLGSDIPGQSRAADTAGRILGIPPRGQRTLPAGVCWQGAARHKAGSWGAGMARARR